MVNIVTELGAGEEVLISRKTANKAIVPSYDCIGGNMRYQTRVKNYPHLYKTIQAMSKQVAWLWWELIDVRDPYTNIAVYRPEGKAATNRLSVAYKVLEGLKLVRRVKQQHYLINPRAFLSDFAEFKAVLRQWEENNEAGL